MRLLLITGGFHPYHLTTPVITKTLRSGGHTVSGDEIGSANLRSRLFPDMTGLSSIPGGETSSSKRLSRSVFLIRAAIRITI